MNKLNNKDELLGIINKLSQLKSKEEGHNRLYISGAIQDLNEVVNLTDESRQKWNYTKHKE